MHPHLKNRSAVEIREHKLVFFAAPKVASSSIKKMIFEIVHGKPFVEDLPDGSKYRIHHDFSPTRRFLEIRSGRYDSWTKATIVRDPVERIISAYTNRVVDRKILSDKHISIRDLEKLDLHPNPSLNFFMNNIEKYRILSRPIWHHTSLFVEYLGYDIDYFDHVFKFDELGWLAEFFTEQTGRKAVLPPATNRSKTKHTFDMMDDKARASLLTYCAGDYALLKDYYRPPMR